MLRHLKQLTKGNKMQNTNLSKFLQQTSGFGTSAKYAIANTGSMLTHLETLGFQVASFTAGRTKDAAKQGFQKHIVRLRSNNFTALKVGDSVPEICLVNAYDGSTSVQLFAGLFRLVCANGLMVGSTFGNDFRIRHVGEIAPQLTLAVDGIAAQLPNVVNAVKQLQSTMPSEATVAHLTQQTLALVVPETATNVSTEDLLRVKRFGDAGQDLWSIYNRLQEGAVRGGVRYQTVAEGGQVRNHSTRAIKSVGRQVDVNRELWDLVQKAV